MLNAAWSASWLYPIYRRQKSCNIIRCEKPDWQSGGVLFFTNFANSVGPTLLCSYNFSRPKLCFAGNYGFTLKKVESVVVVVVVVPEK